MLSHSAFQQTKGGPFRFHHDDESGESYDTLMSSDTAWFAWRLVKHESYQRAKKARFRGLASKIQHGECLVLRRVSQSEAVRLEKA